METYEIVRFYENADIGNYGQVIIKRGLTLEEAKKHCYDPETSSKTAMPPKGCGNNEAKISKWHEEQRHWFDGWRKTR